ncbi:thrombospondin-1-like [Lingula anatina]|uniref:Thrombospondin-1-like n=1 Tax=Lingula anatina TaxID=7574 RepID=A0A1S3I452_LINAN|nr:thrombospondin-1-like [Lingula anatina]|eukprot:XP_013392139.1 thrombospondin-1-like [Lingula anatina]
MRDNCCSTCEPNIAVQSCSHEPCPVDGGWTSWSEYGPCTKTCGEGVQVRSRICGDPPIQGKGRPCPGPASEFRECIAKQCPVDGQWGSWCCTWSDCSATCGGGRRSRVRDCNNPAPSNGGKNCTGKNTQEEECNTQPCPAVRGGWTMWSEWSPCNKVTCQVTRSRSCKKPSPANGGEPCTGPKEQSRNCLLLCCVDGLIEKLGLEVTSYNWYKC